MLGTEASIALRDQLLTELKEIGSAEEAANWAHRVLGAKNSLAAADARQVEDAFRVRLTMFGSAADIGEKCLATGYIRAAALFVTPAAVRGGREDNHY